MSLHSALRWPVSSYDPLPYSFPYHVLYPEVSSVSPVPKS